MKKENELQFAKLKNSNVIEQIESIFKNTISSRFTECIFKNDI